MGWRKNLVAFGEVACSAMVVKVHLLRQYACLRAPCTNNYSALARNITCNKARRRARGQMCMRANITCIINSARTSNYLSDARDVRACICMARQSW